MKNGESSEKRNQQQWQAYKWQRRRLIRRRSESGRKSISGNRRGEAGVA